MAARTRLAALLVLLSGVSVSIGGVFLYQLRRLALWERRDSLVHLVSARATLIESIAADQRAQDSTAAPELVLERTITVLDRVQDVAGFGETGEFILAETTNGGVEFLWGWRHGDPDELDTVLPTTALGTPLDQALSGRSGWVVGPDYRGEEVLAAFAYLPTLDIALVAKIDMAEVRGPLLNATLAAAAVSLLFIGVALLLFRRLSEPIIDEIRAERDRALQAEEQLRNIVEHSVNVFYSHGTDHVLTYLSPQVRAVLDCEPDEAKVRWTEFLTENPVNEHGIRSTERVIQTGVAQPPYELELRGKSGRVVWVEVREAPLVRHGEVQAIVGSLTDITERKESEDALRLSRERIREFAADREQRVEVERLGLAQDLHDELGQLHTALRMDLTWLRDRLPPDDTAGRGRVVEAIQLVERAVRSSRRIAHQLRPPALELGLDVALQKLLDDMASHSGLVTRMDLSTETSAFLPKLDPLRTLGVYRVVQEALTNVARHAGANVVRVSCDQVGSAFEIRVTDDGRGMTVAPVESGRTFGILGMRERAIAMDGTITVTSAPGEGTTVTLSIPSGPD